ncbi:MAG: hypothetical protein B6242_16605 [Anaerolineaceae bacterium 4572_78]|nr:MAG: hypothetical protein B6242_16605 [Anaerolineaceae bacterium 4572_78]
MDIIFSLLPNFTNMYIYILLFIIILGIPVIYLTKDRGHVTVVFSISLLIFLIGYFGLGYIIYDVDGGTGALFMGRVDLLGPEFRIFLGLGIIISEIGIIAFGLSHRVGTSISAAFVPILNISALGYFLLTAYNTFVPIISYLCPSILSQYCYPTSQAQINTLINSGMFDWNLLVTFVAMIVFAATSNFLSMPHDLAKIKRLEEEVRKYKKILGNLS